MKEQYTSKLTLWETQNAIKLVKDTAERKISQALSLLRVTAPLMVPAGSGMNDDLSGVERKVFFSAGEDGRVLEVVQSLAKWKRMALKKYAFPLEQGLYTDMNAIRRDEREDELHSLFVDQWDWEKIILEENRTLDFLKDTVCRIASAIYQTKLAVTAQYPHLNDSISEEVSFISDEELYQMYPTLSAEEREMEYVKRHPTTFIMGIGAPLPDGKPHSLRAPDYDDWSLNGDLLYWSNVLNRPIEISSMGIRVDGATLLFQLKATHTLKRRSLPYHKAVLEGELPYTIGGGIGQSRLSMLLLEKSHIGEVQVSPWGEAEQIRCREKGISLL